MIATHMITFGALLTCISISAEPDQLVQRLMAEAPRGWSRIEERNQASTAKITLHRWALIDGKRVNLRQFHFQHYSDCGFERLDLKRVDQQQGEKPPLARAYLANDTYGAMVTGNDPASTTQLSWIGKASEAAESIPKDTYFKIGWNATHQLWSRPLSEIFAHPKFRVIEAKESKSGDLDVIQIRFDCITDNPQFQYHNSMVSLCPALDWAIVEASYKFAPNQDYENRIRNTYDTSDSGRFERIKSDVFSFAFDSRNEDHFDFEIISIDNVRPSPERFYLTDFGLPEPVKTMPSYSGSNLHLWLFASAFVLFGIAFGLNRTARRSA